MELLVSTLYYDTVLIKVFLLAFDGFFFHSWKKTCVSQAMFPLQMLDLGQNELYRSYLSSVTVLTFSPTVSLSITLPFYLPHSQSLSLSPIHTQTHTLPFSVSHSISYSQTLSLSLSLSLSQSSLTHSHLLIYCLSQALSLSLTSPLTHSRQSYSISFSLSFSLASQPSLFLSCSFTSLQLLVHKLFTSSSFYPGAHLLKLVLYFVLLRCFPLNISCIGIILLFSICEILQCATIVVTIKGNTVTECTSTEVN